MTQQRTLKAFLTVVRPGERLSLSTDGQPRPVADGWRDRVFVLLTRVPLVKDLQVLRRSEHQLENSNQLVVQEIVRQLEMIYPDSPVPRDVERKYLKRHSLELKHARGVDPAMLAQIAREVHAYQAVLSLSASGRFDQLLNARLATCPDSSVDQDPTAS